MALLGVIGVGHSTTTVWATIGLESVSQRDRVPTQHSDPDLTATDRCLAVCDYSRGPANTTISTERTVWRWTKEVDWTNHSPDLVTLTVVVNGERYRGLGPTLAADELQTKRVSSRYVPI
jgi:hypothetical protein